jgi:multidrug efflux pump subunit AcrA (membrane-fusion protein)
MQTQPTIFREEAVEFRSRGNSAPDDLLRISPGGTGWAYWLLLVLFLACLIYIVFGKIDEYAAGTGVIRDVGRTVITAVTGGTIQRIAVQPGQKVEAGQPLVYFNDSQERIELDRFMKDFNSQQVNRLKNPNDPAAHQQVAALRTQIEAAETRLKERTFLAPSAGIVQDIRIRPNQWVNPGELLLTIVGENDSLAVMPGHYRPLLKKGGPLRFELAGFRYAYQYATITEVGNEVVGPNEVRRFLGQEIADSLTLQGSSVIVQAELPLRRFESGGHWHEYHDGMQTVVDARVRSESILIALVPGLKALVEGNDE